MKYNNQIGGIVLAGLTNSAFAAPAPGIFDSPILSVLANPIAPVESVFEHATSAVVSAEHSITSVVAGVATSVEHKATSVVGSEIAKFTGVITKEMPNLFEVATGDKDPNVVAILKDAAGEVEKFIASTQDCSTVAGMIGHYGIDLVMSGIKTGGDVPMWLLKEAVACEAIMPIDDANGQVNGANFTLGLNVPYKVETWDIGKGICDFVNNELNLDDALHSKYTDFDCWGVGCMTILTLKVHGPDAIQDKTVNDILHFAGKIESHWNGCPNPDANMGAVPTSLTSLLPASATSAAQEATAVTENPASSTEDSSSSTDGTAPATEAPSSTTDAMTTSTDDVTAATEAPSSTTEEGSSTTEESASSTTELAPAGYGTGVPAVTLKTSASASKASSSARRSSVRPSRSSSAAAQVTAPPSYE